MQFVVLGKYTAEGLADSARRVELTLAKANELGLTILNRYLTIGRYDYCTVLEAPSVEAAAEFNRWSRRHGFSNGELLLILDLPSDQLASSATLSTP